MSQKAIRSPLSMPDSEYAKMEYDMTSANLAAFDCRMDRMIAAEKKAGTIRSVIDTSSLRGGSTLRKTLIRVEGDQVRLRSRGVDEELRALEGGGLSGADFAERLGVKAHETVRNYCEKGWIFAWEKDARNLRYPVWQIHKGALLPGLAEVLAVLDARARSPFAIANYFLSESEELGNKRPLDLLRSQRVDEVVAHAKRYGGIGA